MKLEKAKPKKRDWMKNLLFILIAVGVVVVFFNLDIVRKGESVFSQTAENKLYFRGDLTRKAFTDTEVDRFLRYIKRNSDIINSFTIETSVDDSYRKVTPSTQIVFSIRMLMKDGAKISTPNRRTSRQQLVPAIFAKLDKDMRVYRKILKEGKKVKSLVNTM